MELTLDVEADSDERDEPAADAAAEERPAVALHTAQLRQQRQDRHHRRDLEVRPRHQQQQHTYFELPCINASFLHTLRLHNVTSWNDIITTLACTKIRHTFNIMEQLQKLDPHLDSLFSIPILLERDKRKLKVGFYLNFEAKFFRELSFTSDS